MPILTTAPAPRSAPRRHLGSCSALALAATLAAACFTDLGGGTQGETGTGTNTNPTTSPTTTQASTSDTATEPTTTGDPATTAITSTSDPTDATTSGTSVTSVTSVSATDTDTSSSTLPGVCGDGHRDPGEDCDHGNQADDFCAACQRGAYRVFVTKDGMVLGEGLAGADEICQSRAQVAGLPGVYRAWLSSTEIHAVDRVVQTKPAPLRRVDLEVVVATPADLVGGTLLVPIAVTEGGELLNLDPNCAEEAVWTGTNADGTLGISNCEDWTATMDNAGLTGQLGATDEAWTQGPCQVACEAVLHIYCFEIDP